MGRTIAAMLMAMACSRPVERVQQRAEATDPPDAGPASMTPWEYLDARAAVYQQTPSEADASMPLFAEEQPVAREQLDDSAIYCVTATVPPEDSVCWRGAEACRRQRIAIGQYEYSECERVKRAACVRYWRILEEDWGMICAASFRHCNSVRGELLKSREDFSKVQRCVPIE